ncbi:MAG: tRNA uridine-5-carboxymethylaminomethyl(34) synthesis GTPase MnmE, partial [Treponema sp.]|nr:tRNA uridine-5-carboxymethylaminomethyl(34) synthesis GTPase MnmE [Treponema sp.]
MGYTPEEAIAAIATPLSPGAIGIVRTSGKGCIQLVAKIFSRPNALLASSPNSLVYGWLLDGTTKIDEVMLGVYKSPKSFTGEDMVEVYCHGGVSVVKAVLSLLLKNGFRQAERGEFTFRAYINGKTDLTKAEAVREIIDSKTDGSRGRAAGRLAGNLFAEIDSIKKLIVDTLAAIDVQIEYPDDEENISDTFDETNLRKAVKRLRTLADSWKSEKLYQDGARLVLCGKTNAGKSSLFNSL